MPVTNEAALERIRKLIKVATGAGATEAEVENYMAKARQMMDELNITESEVMVKDEDAQKQAYDSIHESESFSRSGGLELFFKTIASTVCEICDVRWFRRTKWAPNPTPRGKETHHEREFIIYYGMPRDVAVAKEMTTELIATVHTMARVRYGKGWSKSHMDYSRGFTQRLYERACAMKVQPDREASGCTAIVLVKEGLLRRWAQDKLSLRPGRASRTTIKDGSAYVKGQADGANVSLGTNQIRATTSPQRKRLA